MLNTENKTIGQIFEENQAKYILISNDETRYWITSVKDKLNAAYSIYLLKNQPTNICSIDINYPAIAMYNSFDIKDKYYEDIDIMDELHKAEIENINSEIVYYHENLIPHEYYIVDNPDDYETEEEMKEYYCGNHMI